MASAEEWTFLPGRPLFRPLIGDPREPGIGLSPYLDRTRYEGSLGTSFDLLRFRTGAGAAWSWGIFGGCFILLDQEGAAFPMRANDWYAGLSLSHSAGPFSHRLQFTHQSSHLGDSLEGLAEPSIYNGERFDLTTSFEPAPDLRFYGGAGFWENLFPYDKVFFASLGTEAYSAPFGFAGLSWRGYGTFHLKWKAQAGGSLNKTLQLGFQLKGKPEDPGSVRLALVWQGGKDEFGQFYQEPDDHWALGIYFDP